MREVYRLHKNDLYIALGKNKKLLAFIYFSKKQENYSVIEKSMLSQLEVMKSEKAD